MFHVTTPLFVAQLPLALTKLTPAGKASVTVTLLALLGPRFVTLIWYTKLLVAGTVPEALFPIARSNTGVTVVVTGGVTLFVGFGSFGSGPTLARLVRLPLTGAVTVSVKFVT